MLIALLMASVICNVFLLMRLHVEKQLGADTLKAYQRCLTQIDAMDKK